MKFKFLNPFSSETPLTGFRDLDGQILDLNVGIPLSKLRVLNLDIQLSDLDIHMDIQILHFDMRIPDFDIQIQDFQI